VQETCNALAGVAKTLYCNGNLIRFPAALLLKLFQAVVRAAPCGVVAPNNALQVDGLARDDGWRPC